METTHATKKKHICNINQSPREKCNNIAPEEQCAKYMGLQFVEVTHIIFKNLKFTTNQARPWVRANGVAALPLEARGPSCCRIYVAWA
jgi:hypothetical protein